jgi:hypothetical protein
MLNLGVTQLNKFGLTKPNTHPIVTHNGNVVDIASPATSSHSLKLFPPTFALSLFDEMPQRSGPKLEMKILRDFNVEMFNGD